MHLLRGTITPPTFCNTCSPTPQTGPSKFSFHASHTPFKWPKLSAPKANKGARVNAVREVIVWALGWWRCGLSTGSCTQNSLVRFVELHYCRPRYCCLEGVRRGPLPPPPPPDSSKYFEKSGDKTWQQTELCEALASPWQGMSDRRSGPHRALLLAPNCAQRAAEAWPGPADCASYI